MRIFCLGRKGKKFLISPPREEILYRRYGNVEYYICLSVYLFVVRQSSGRRLKELKYSLWFSYTTGEMRENDGRWKIYMIYHSLSCLLIAPHRRRRRRRSTFIGSTLFLLFRFDRQRYKVDTLKEINFSGFFNGASSPGRECHRTNWYLNYNIRFNAVCKCNTHVI